MACNSCGSGFGLLKKEIGCETCGFSFCSKCCTKKLVTNESGESSKQYICSRCFDNLASKKPSTTSFSPPLAHKKRMAKFASRSMSLGSSENRSASSWDNEKDKEIAERLQKLKRGWNKEVSPSQLEIEERLAKLKGMDPAKYTAPPIMVYRPQDKRSSVERAHDLMKQIVEEVQIDAKRGRPEDEIAAKLAHLRGENVSAKPESETIVPTVYKEVESSFGGSMQSNEDAQKLFDECKSMVDEACREAEILAKHEDYKKAMKSVNRESKKRSDDEDFDEDEEAAKIAEKLMAANLDNSEMDDPESLNDSQVRSPDDVNEKNGSDEDQEEFPWCVICTEDAKIRCFGCDSDLYCINCFRECHDSLDIKDHKTCPFLFAKKM